MCEQTVNSFHANLHILPPACIIFGNVVLSIAILRMVFLPLAKKHISKRAVGHRLKAFLSAIDNQNETPTVSCPILETFTLIASEWHYRHFFRNFVMFWRSFSFNFEWLNLFLLWHQIYIVEIEIADHIYYSRVSNIFSCVCQSGRRGESFISHDAVLIGRKEASPSFQWEGLGRKEVSPSFQWEGLGRKEVSPSF